MTFSINLLELLKQARGHWLSGESISAMMGISRSAVWKQVSKLREEGYVVEGSPKKGYALREAPDRLLPGEIQDGLGTRVFGKGEILHFRETSSTNTIAKELALRGAAEGLLVLAEEQSGGRGRRGREWHSPLGKGIYFSMVLRPRIAPAEAPKMSILAAVAVAEAMIAAARVNARIKWPNDVLIGGKKVAGILAEVGAEMDEVQYLVIGIGVNVNNTGFPPELRQQATSLHVETGKPFPRLILLKEILARFEALYEEAMSKGFNPCMARWRELSDMLGMNIRVEVPGLVHEGLAEDIGQDGSLLLRDGKGKVHKIVAGDVTFIGGIYGGQKPIG